MVFSNREVSPNEQSRGKAVDRRLTEANRRDRDESVKSIIEIMRQVSGPDTSVRGR